MDSPGNSRGVDCHFLLQGILPTQGSNPGLPHCRQTLYRLSHQGSRGRTQEVKLVVSGSSHGSSTEPVLHLDPVSSWASIIFTILIWEEGCPTGISSSFRRNIHQPLSISEGWSQSLNERYWVGEKVLLGSSLIWYGKHE